jgi:hypothetical protein
MWMRSCAVCKALLKKLRLTDSAVVSVDGSGWGIEVGALVMARTGD